MEHVKSSHELGVLSPLRISLSSCALQKDDDQESENSRFVGSLMVSDRSHAGSGLTEPIAS
jgi:hypothetical protein